MKIEQAIETRIEELKKIRNSSSRCTKSKYNFCIGELQWILKELDGL